VSSSLFWKPVIPQRENTLPDNLKYILGKKYWNHDGTLTSPPLVLDEDNLEYLSGLVDAGVEGAEELVEAIRKHGRVEIWISH
jgi:hypothetical protein